MQRRRLIAAAVIILLGGGAYLVWRLTHPTLSDQQQIEELLDRIEQGVEKKSPRMILGAIADDYRDDYGLTRLDIHRLSLNLLRTEGRIQVVLTRPKIEVHGEQATADVTGEVTLSEGGYQAQEFSGALTIHLRKRGGQWRIVSTGGWQGEVMGGFEE